MRAGHGRQCGACESGVERFRRLGHQFVASRAPLRLLQLHKCTRQRRHGVDCHLAIRAMQSDDAGQSANALAAREATLNATPDSINAQHETAASAERRRLGREKHSLPPISLGTFSMSSSPSSSPPPPAVSTPPPPSAMRSSSGQSARNGLIFARHHRPVVRSQSSRISLLRQPPQSASSVTSGPDDEHFPMPDK